MQKEIKTLKVPFDFSWTYGVTIEKLRKDLDELDKLEVKKIEIQGLEITIDAFANRIETDKEYVYRINELNRRNEEIKRVELEQLQKLKLKYEK